MIENDIKLSKSYLSDHFKSFSVSRYYTVHKREKKEALQCGKRKF